MTAKGQSGKVVLDNITAHELWVDRLLELFWAVDKVVAGGDEDIPEDIYAAYDAADHARQAL